MKSFKLVLKFLLYCDSGFCCGTTASHIIIVLVFILISAAYLYITSFRQIYSPSCQKPNSIIFYFFLIIKYHVYVMNCLIKILKFIIIVAYDSEWVKLHLKMEIKTNILNSGMHDLYCLTNYYYYYEYYYWYMEFCAFHQLMNEHSRVNVWCSKSQKDANLWKCYPVHSIVKLTCDVPVSL